MVRKPSQTIFGVMFPSWSVGGGTPKLGVSSLMCHSLMKVFLFCFESNSLFFLAARVRPKLKSRYEGHVKDTSDYAKTI